MAKAASQRGGAAPSGRRRSPVPPPGGSGTTTPRAFLRESYGELRKVQWPTRQQVVQGTIVVFLVTAIFALYLTLVDAVVVKLVHQLDKWLA